MNPSERRIKWHLNVSSPVVSSPLFHNGILVAATYDSWIRGTPFTGENFLVGIDTETRKEIWRYQITGELLHVSSPSDIDDTM